MHHASGYGIARERYAQQATLLVAQMTAAESVSIAQLAEVLHAAKPFSILHSHSKLEIPWSSRNGSAIFTVPVTSSSAESLSVDRQNHNICESRLTILTS
jgi:hypothetical protein